MLGIIESYYDAFNHGDAERILSLIDEGLLHEPCQAMPRQGIGAYREFLDKRLRCYKERAIDPLVLYSPGITHAAAEFILEGKYVKTDEPFPPARGQHYRLRAGAFFEIGGNRITRLTMHYNLADWIDQVSA
ncbi:nuclear transport factor 2 family protein [Sphingomonas sp. C3-2]|uniref:nuclear transport factor 2 family protein n=1 Tax=Sphingomonas sp. C3-2 TaxID=3062169 RepID=UPI00294B7430|nr:nuclear transport factor 2 family protein [Sphingomonas sp. C3-2]WOK35568.1 nuclear transport factor 2 family protein [Sphingomonas sp. C3-2]